MTVTPFSVYLLGTETSNSLSCMRSGRAGSNTVLKNPQRDASDTIDTHALRKREWKEKKSRDHL